MDQLRIKGKECEYNEKNRHWKQINSINDDVMSSEIIKEYITMRKTNVMS